MVTSQTDARGNTSSYTYDSRGLLIREDGPSGERSEYEWDPVYGLPTEIRVRVSASPLVERVTEIDYTPAGLPDTRTQLAPDPADNIVTDFDWTPYAELQRITDPVGNVSEASYDAAGRILMVTSQPGTADVRRVRYSYDRNGRVTGIDRALDQAGTAWVGGQISYGENGRASSVSDAAGDTTHFAYNNRRLLSMVTDPLGRQTRYAYLRSGLMYCERRAFHDDGPGGLRQTYRRTRYSVWGEVDNVVPAKGDPDADCNPNTSVEAYYDYRTGYSQDVYGRTDRTWFPEETTNSFTDNNLNERIWFDVVDNQVAFRNRNGDDRTMAYDASNRLVSKQTPEGIFTNEYNLAGDVVRAWGLDGRCTEYAFDFAGRMAFERQRLNCGDRTDPNYGAVAATGAANVSLETGYEYDAAGRRTAIVWPADPGGDRYTARYSYTPFGELESVCEDADGDGSCERVLSRYSYDRLGNLVSVDYGDNASAPVSSMSMAYEVDGDFARLDHRFSGESAANRDVSFRYAYNAAGELVSEYELRNSGATRSWMWEATATRSNPQSGHTVRDEVMNVTVDGTALSLSWDNNGNILSRQPGNLIFVHDSENRMISGASPQHSWAYSYDAGGRRIVRDVDGGLSFVAHAGNMEIAEYVVTAVGQSGGDPVWTWQIAQRYVPGAGVDQRVAMINTAASGAATGRYYYHVNRLGSVIAMVDDASGQVTDHYVYTPFGVEGQYKLSPK